MIKEFLQTKRGLSIAEGKEEVVKRKPSRVMMDHPQLSLGPSLSPFDSEASPCRKRKHSWDEPSTQASIELHLNDPLPLDWEQCLDLQSGRMYYLNRKSLKKSWSRPKEEKLDLELNISTPPSSDWRSTGLVTQESSLKQSNSSGNMVAVACLNCHLLVMLCRSSPSCPNCKYVHSLPRQQAPPGWKIERVPAKPLETLSLLN